jgi:16S rRNA (cytidine1402-2'-O)-methyltransferase
LCEDTRRSGKLLSYFKIKNKLLPYHKFNEKKISGKVVDAIKKNQIISLISDAGTPAISDPGMILVNRCIDADIAVHPVPGPSAAASAISVSGFSDRYLFYGFLAKKEKELENTLKSLCNISYSIVFFVPAIKINFYLLKFKKYFLDRKILIAKEMTKIHEEFIRGNTQSDKILPNSIKGELTIVLSEKIIDKNIKKEINETVKIEINEMLLKYSHKDVVEFFSKKENLPKKIIYNFCLKLIK